MTITENLRSSGNEYKRAATINPLLEGDEEAYRPNDVDANVYTEYENEEAHDVFKKAQFDHRKGLFSSGGNDKSDGDDKPVDYQKLYEDARKENQKLRKTIKNIKKSAEVEEESSL
jgi:hypothetical protein